MVFSDWPVSRKSGNEFLKIRNQCVALTFPVVFHRIVIVSSDSPMFTVWVQFPIRRIPQFNSFRISQTRQVNYCRYVVLLFQDFVRTMMAFSDLSVSLAMKFLTSKNLPPVCSSASPVVFHRIIMVSSDSPMCPQE